MRKELETLPKWIVYLFFMIGVISAIGFRALIFVQKYDPILGRIIWYTSVIGYIFFFLYRWKISQKRRSVIEKYGLIGKIRGEKKLGARDQKALLYIISSIQNSLENHNYYVIFVLSIWAITLDIILNIYGI